jgi:hypothetical protein
MEDGTCAVDTGYMGSTPNPAMRAWIWAATAAPSIHNSQPWLFEPDGDRIHVFLDRRRQLPALDGSGRAMHLSVGAAVFNLRVAMLDSGWFPRVRLMPDPNRPDLAATVTVGEPAPEIPGARLLAGAIPYRRSSRRPFVPGAMPADAVAALITAPAAEGGTLLLPGDSLRHEILHLVRVADLIQAEDARYRTELAAWTARRPHRADGVPKAAFGPKPNSTVLPLRDFGLVHGHHRKTAWFEPNPTLAVLYTRGDEPVDWLRAGMALQRTLLTATVKGLATSLMTQPIEVPAIRERLARPPFAAWYEPHAPQAVLRLGYAGRSPATPRRPVAEVLAA